MPNAKSLVIGSFYRPPDENAERLEQLDLSLQNLPSRCHDKTIHLGGDFNASGIDWDLNSVVQGADHPGVCHKLLEIQADHSLSQLQLESTRGKNNLDLFFTNNPSLIKSVQTAPWIGDHDMVVVEADIKPMYTNTLPRSVPQFRKADWPTIREAVTQLQSDILDHDKFEQNSVNDNWELFKHGLLDITKRLIPHSTARKPNSLPWFDNHIRKAVLKKQRLFYLAKKKPSDKTRARYKAQKVLVRKLIYSAHRRYITNILDPSLSQHNLKAFWRYIKSKRNDGSGVSAIREGSRLVSDPRSKAELLNKQFQSAFTKEDTENVPLPHGEAYPAMFDLEISVHGVELLLQRLNPSKASGPDNIANRLLKEAAKEIAPILTAIFQQSYERGELPADWKEARVTPIFKKGDRNVSENYRPVSLTCVSSKLMEHVVSCHIMDHLDRHKILSAYQHGFRKLHSCATQLLMTTHDFLSSLDHKVQVDVAVLDFSKAFDTVPHLRLMKKLDHYGIRDKGLIWIKEFLSDRTQQVVIDGVSSDKVKVESGVPQGTVLGPLLFLLHINDLPEAVTSQVRLFADDCLIYREIRSIADQIELQRDLERLHDWASTWGMRFNAKKCNILRIHRRAKTPFSFFYELDRHILEEVTTSKYLGLNFSDDMKWDDHISAICAKANSTLGFLRRNLKFAPKSLKEVAYKTLVRSKLEFAAIVWDPFLVKNIDKLEKVQRKAARFVCRDYRRDSSVTKMLESLNWPPLAQRRSEQRIAFMKKILSYSVAVPADQYTKPGPQRTRSKNNQKLQTVRTNTEEFRHSFFPKTIQQWNQRTEAEIDLICSTAADANI